MKNKWIVVGGITAAGLTLFLLLKNRGPTTSLYGTVRDAVTLEGIPGATVRISQVPASVINFTRKTDSGGFYSFASIPLLEDRAVVVDTNAFTYMNDEQWIWLFDEDNVLNIRLNPI